MEQNNFIKNTIFLIFLLSTSLTFSQSRQESYRWRNDNAGETNATWKANKNVPSVPDNIGIPFRLRIQVQRASNPFTQGDFDTHPFQYRKNGSSWINITSSNLNDIYFVSSAFVLNGNFTTQQISTTSYDTGRFKSSNNNSLINLNTSRSTEIEYSIARSSSYDIASTYEFRIQDLASYTIYPRLDPIATHLNFDGVNDYVQLPNESNFDFLGNEMTVEFWMKSNVSNPDQWDALITKGDDSWRIHLNASGTINCAFNGTTAVFDSTIPVTDGNWHHISVTLGANMASLYIDGSLNTSTSFSGTLNNSSFPVAIGQNLQQTVGRFFTGDIDDVRFWNVARTASQINGSKNCELQGNETGLIAYYKFNQGSGGANNSAITTLNDETTNANNGTLNNFALTGTTSNWLAGSTVTSGSIVPSNAMVTTPVTYSQGDTATPLTATTGTNGTGLLWYTTATGGTGSSTAPTPSTATVGSTSYWVSSTNANGCESERQEIVVNVTLPATHLNFDGTNDRINCGNDTSIQITGSNITLEAIIRLNSFASFPNDGNIINKEQNSPDNGYMLRVGGSGIVNFNIGNGSWNEINSPVNAVQLNTWHHVAGTYDGATMKIYVDGVMVASQASTVSIGNSTSNLFIGDWPSGGRYLDGDIDEVRIWNVTLNDAQIQNGINCELQNPTTQNGLTAYYKFNQGNSASNNSTITTLTDNSVNTNNGVLSGFALTGNNSNWLSGSSITTGSNCATLSITRFNSVLEAIKLYPNPTSGNVFIETTNLTKPSVSVYDLNGRVIFSNTYFQDTTSINMTNYQAGVYLVKVISQEGEIIKKLIKQ